MAVHGSEGTIESAGGSPQHAAMTFLSLSLIASGVASLTGATLPSAAPSPLMPRLGRGVRQRTASRLWRSCVRDPNAGVATTMVREVAISTLHESRRDLGASSRCHGLGQSGFPLPGSRRYPALVKHVADSLLIQAQFVSHSLHRQPGRVEPRDLVDYRFWGLGAAPHGHVSST